MKTKWRWHEIYGLFVGFTVTIFLFVFVATSFAEKQIQALVAGSTVFVALLAILIIFVSLKVKGTLEGLMTQRLILGSLALFTFFVVLLFVPTQRDSDSQSCGTTEISEEQDRYDARDQPGSDLYVKMSQSVHTDVLTLTIYDICVGKISYKVHRDGTVNLQRIEIINRAVLTEHIKDEAKSLGAKIVGITELEPEYVFTHDQAGNPITLTHKYAIIMGKDLRYMLAGPSAPMPWEHLYSSLPEELAAALSGQMIKSTVKIPEETIQEVKETLKFFSEGGRTAVELAEYIRGLGYSARAHYQRWSEVQIVPLAIKAGLGELGRNGMLLTMEVGPRGSFSVVTTDLPLIPDKPVDLGIKEFCKVCKKCAQSCPVKAIPYGDPQIVRGVLKWPLDGDKCFKYLVSNPKCLACIASCPYNKPGFFVHRLAAFLASRKSIVANFVLVKLDDILGYGKIKVKQEELNRGAGS